MLKETEGSHMYLKSGWCLLLMILACVAGLTRTPKFALAQNKQPPKVLLAQLTNMSTEPPSKTKEITRKAVEDAMDCITDATKEVAQGEADYFDAFWECLIRKEGQSYFDTNYPQILCALFYNWHMENTCLNCYTNANPGTPCDKNTTCQGATARCQDCCKLLYYKYIFEEKPAVAYTEYIHCASKGGCSAGE